MFWGRGGKVSFPQTHKPSASAFQVLELQTGTGMPLLSYCFGAGELSMIFNGSLKYPDSTSLKPKSGWEKRMHRH